MGSNAEKVIEAINDMNRKGIPLTKIRQNLKQLGLSEKQIDVLISKSEIQPTPSEIHEAVTSIDQKISSGEHIKPLHAELKKNTEETIETKENVEAMQDELEEHRKKLEEIHELVLGMSGKPGQENISLEEKVDNLANQIQELIPMLKSIDTSVKKMLELNRKVLLK